MFGSDGLHARRACVYEVNVLSTYVHVVDRPGG